MKKVRYILATLMVAAIVAVVLVGCKKEKEATEQPVAPKGILCFNSAEEFTETYKKVVVMTEEERRAWEQQQGFKSYATKCNELFEAFEAKGINSDEDIINFVNENSDYFYIREEDGEKYLTSYLEYSDYYYTANEDRMLQINKVAIKAFDEVLLISDSQNIDYLSKFTKNDTIYFDDNEYGLKYILTNNSCVKSNDDYCWRSDNGNDRTYARVYFETHINYKTWTVDRGYIKLHIRPYHRVLGIWYYCGRHISWDVYAKIKWDAAFYHYYDDTTSGESHSTSPVSASEITRTLQTLIIPETGGWTNYRFIRISGWAETPSAPRVMCNL